MLNIPFYKNTGSRTITVPRQHGGVVAVPPGKWVGGNFYSSLTTVVPVLRSNTDLEEDPVYTDIMYIYESDAPAINVEKDEIIASAPALTVPGETGQMLFNDNGALGAAGIYVIDDTLYAYNGAGVGTLTNAVFGDTFTIQVFPSNHNSTTDPISDGPDMYFNGGSVEVPYQILEGGGRGGDIWLTAGNAGRAQFDTVGGRGGDIHLVPGNKAGFVPESRPGAIIVHNQLRLSNDWGGVAFLEEVTHGGGRLYLSRGTGSSQDVTLDVGTDNQYPFLQLTGWMNSNSPYSDYSKLTMYAGNSDEYGIEVSTSGSGTANIAFNIKTAGTGKVKLNNTLNVANVPTYADNAAAVTGGLAVGDVYKTAAGDLKIRV
jgi:hypothetical protein